MHHFDLHHTQIRDILCGWSIPQGNAAIIADVLGWADLRGIDSHGISILTVYDEWRRLGRLDMEAQPEVLRETPASVLLSGNGGLGHPVAKMAMEMIIAKAGMTGVAAASVTNSSHYGACGYFTEMAADAGLIGISTTTTPGVRVAPTGGAEAKLGTDPFSFAAPAADGRHFILDMATTTVAYGKIRNKANEGEKCPPGWVLSSDGKPSNDPVDALERGGFQTPLGGTPEGSSHKGYGLSMMVNILSSALSGARLITAPDHIHRPDDLGHFFLVLDPGLFREEGEFELDVASLCNSLRGTMPVDNAHPVLVAGDPERVTAAKRMKEGLTIPAGLATKLRKIATDAQVPWHLG